MSEGMIIAIISGVLTLAGVVLTQLGANLRFNHTMKDSTKETISHLQNELEKNNVLVNERIEELTREVRKHNEFAVRVPVLENEVKNIKESIHK